MKRRRAANVNGFCRTASTDSCTTKLKFLSCVHLKLRCTIYCLLLLKPFKNIQIFSLKYGQLLMPTFPLTLKNCHHFTSQHTKRNPMTCLANPHSSWKTTQSPIHFKRKQLPQQSIHLIFHSLNSSTNPLPFGPSPINAAPHTRSATPELQNCA